MNALAVIYVNQHLESLRSEASQRRAASLAERRSLRDRLASAAADLEKRRRVRETASERRDDQAVPRAEPEAPLLHVGERLEEIGIEARARHAGNARPRQRLHRNRSHRRS